jgi:hypothetical protein
VILLVSHRGDRHLRAIEAALQRRRAPAALLDTSRFPRRARLAFGYHGRREELCVETSTGLLRAADLRAIWWRRPLPFAPDPALPLGSHRRFAARETAEAFAALWLSAEVDFVNDPRADEAAGRKGWQLRVARAAGLEVPRTCITNDPAAARAFLDEAGGGPVVYKALSATPETWRETRMVGPAERRLLPLLRHAPVIFQEYVPGVDLRVTVVGERIFAAEIDARRARYPGDFRVDMERARVQPVRLPPGVEEGVRALLSAFGLSYAAIDLRRTGAGRHLFLELNPSGQWLFVEERTGLPITEALAERLAGGG